jgi:hypothetical protein
MNPKTKKKIVLFSCLGGGLVVLGIAAAIVLPIVLKVDYAGAYKVAKELKPKVREMSYSSACESVVSHVYEKYVSERTYNDYVDKCKGQAMNLGDLIGQLGDTDGVGRNDEIKGSFEQFSAAYDQAFGEWENTEKMLPVWAVWHKFVVTSVEYGDGEGKITAKANILINSGNEKLKKYGEGWLAVTLAAERAYVTYRGTSYSNKDYQTFYNDYKAKTAAQSEFVSANKPAISEVAPLAADGSRNGAVQTAFDSLYEKIRVAYVANYRAEDGLCVEFLGIVGCE